MREDLLHFIWRFRHFNQQQLFTEAGEAVQVLFPGEYHADQGPDFRRARVRIGERVLEGPVELHVHASDWVRHAHDEDIHYKNTILHVVWVNDWPGNEPTPGNIPILELQERVPKLLLSRYDRWMKHPVFVPCERQLPELDANAWPGWLETLVVQRLGRKALEIRQCLAENRHHWEATTWIRMAQSMGLPVNADVFEAVARSLPVELLARYREQPLALEALLLGQAGLLGGPPPEAAVQAREGMVAVSQGVVGISEGAVPAPAGMPGIHLRTLQQEYRFLRTKLGLAPVSMPVSFLRMRPANFPTVRLRQLAGLLRTGVGWFARIREAGSPGEVWAEVEGLGAATRDKVVINAFVPLLYTYGWLRQEPAMQEKAIRWLRETRVEKNTILSRWRELGVTAGNAADGQALLELKKQYCDVRRCLDCAIGNRWLISLVNNG
ncbi:MAG TPA: DUF2851 family protein [Puia sp.]|nr:DUF2851 family protein [Puia sp.]